LGEPTTEDQSFQVFEDFDFGGAFDCDTTVLPTVEQDELFMQAPPMLPATRSQLIDGNLHSESMAAAFTGSFPARFAHGFNEWQLTPRAMTSGPDLEYLGHHLPNEIVDGFDEGLNSRLLPALDFPSMSNLNPSGQLFNHPQEGRPMTASNISFCRDPAGTHVRAQSLPNFFVSRRDELSDIAREPEPIRRICASVGTPEIHICERQNKDEEFHYEGQEERASRLLSYATTPGLSAATSSRDTSAAPGTQTPALLEEQSGLLAQGHDLVMPGRSLARAIQAKNLPDNFLEKFQATYPNFQKLPAAASETEKAGDMSSSGEAKEGEERESINPKIRRSRTEQKEPPYSCPSGCSEIFNEAQVFRQHIKINHNEEYALCKHTDCVKAVRNDEEPNMLLVWHYKTDHGQHALRCLEHPNCGFRVTFDEKKFIEHVESHKLRCHFCFDEGKRANPFANVENLRIHIKKMHSAQSFPCTGYDFVKGQPCRQRFTTEASRTKHMNSAHKGQFLCPYCPTDDSVQMFLTEKLLALHIRDVHMDEYGDDWATKAGEKTFKCPHCGKTSSKNSNLQKHISSLHEGEKRWKCNATDLRICDRMVDDDGNSLLWDPAGQGCETAFANKQSLIDHVRSTHFGLMRWEALRKARSGQTLESAGERKTKKRISAKPSATGVLSGVLND
jgi:uncharacterized C2H2 Zn-finger protein